MSKDKVILDLKVCCSCRFYLTQAKPGGLVSAPESQLYYVGTFWLGCALTRLGPRSSHSSVNLTRSTGESSVLGAKSYQRLTGRRWCGYSQGKDEAWIMDMLLNLRD